MRRFSLFFAALVLLAGCRKRDETPAPPPPPAAAETKPGVLRVEGLEEPVTLEKVDLPAAPFTTFAPQHTFSATAEQLSTGTEVWFRGSRERFGPDTYVWFAFPHAATADSLRDALVGDGGLLAREGLVPQTAPSPCLWAVEGGTVAAAEGGDTGLWCIGEHGGSTFFVVTRHAAEAGDGFGPRLDVLFDEFRWRDTGAALGGE